MKGTTFNQLTTFHAIVQEGSIRGAARKLEIAPPSVSQSLKQLETQLGLPLFTRSTRRIELTEAGQQLYEQTINAISTLDYALESVQDLSESPSGKVSITLPRFVFQFFFKPIYAEFCQRYPDIQLEISVSDEAVNILNEGFDLGIRFGDRIETGMVARQITAAHDRSLFCIQGLCRKERPAQGSGRSAAAPLYSVPVYRFQPACPAYPERQRTRSHHSTADCADR